MTYLRLLTSGTLKESGAKSPYKARAFRDICVVASAWADRLVA